MARSQILTRVPPEMHEAAKLAVRILGYKTLTAMMRESVEERIAWAKAMAPYFEQALQDRLKEQSDD